MLITILLMNAWISGVFSEINNDLDPRIEHIFKDIVDNIMATDFRELQTCDVMFMGKMTSFSNVTQIASDGTVHLHKFTAMFRKIQYFNLDLAVITNVARFSNCVILVSNDADSFDLDTYSTIMDQIHYR